MELASAPGRFGDLMRITVCCTLIVVIWIVFQIPVPAFAAYIVFLLNRGEASGTLIVRPQAPLPRRWRSHSRCCCTPSTPASRRCGFVDGAVDVHRHVFDARDLGRTDRIPGRVRPRDYSNAHRRRHEYGGIDALRPVALGCHRGAGGHDCIGRSRRRPASPRPRAHSMAALFDAATSRLRDATSPVVALQTAAPEFAALRERLRSSIANWRRENKLT